MINQWNKIKNNFKPTDLFIDVGVARVDTEAWMVKKDWPNTEIIGFEPCTARSKKISNYPGVLLKMAVGDSIREINGYENNYDFKSCFEIDDKDPYLPSTQICTTVDEIIRIASSKSAFLWADVEGSEMLVIQGAKGSLQNHIIKGLNLELWPWESKTHVPGWANDKEIVELLNSYGYKCDDYLDWDRKSQTDFIFHL